MNLLDESFLRLFFRTEKRPVASSTVEPLLRPFVIDQIGDLRLGITYCLHYANTNTVPRGYFLKEGIRMNSYGVNLVRIMNREGIPDLVSLDDLWLQGTPKDPDALGESPLYIVLEKNKITWPEEHHQA